MLIKSLQKNNDRKDISNFKINYKSKSISKKPEYYPLSEILSLRNPDDNYEFDFHLSHFKYKIKSDIHLKRTKNEILDLDTDIGLSRIAAFIKNLMLTTGLSSSSGVKIFILKYKKRSYIYSAGSIYDYESLEPVIIFAGRLVYSGKFPINISNFKAFIRFSNQDLFKAIQPLLPNVLSELTMNVNKSIFGEETLVGTDVELKAKVVKNAIKTRNNLIIFDAVFKYNKVINDINYSIRYLEVNSYIPSSTRIHTNTLDIFIKSIIAREILIVFKDYVTHKNFINIKGDSGYIDNFINKVPELNNWDFARIINHILKGTGKLPKEIAHLSLFKEYIEAIQDIYILRYNSDYSYKIETSKNSYLNIGGTLHKNIIYDSLTDRHFLEMNIKKMVIPSSLNLQLFINAIKVNVSSENSSILDNRIACIVRDLLSDKRLKYHEYFYHYSIENSSYNIKLNSIRRTNGERIININLENLPRRNPFYDHVFRVGYNISTSMLLYTKEGNKIYECRGFDGKYYVKIKIFNSTGKRINKIAFVNDIYSTYDRWGDSLNFSYREISVNSPSKYIPRKLINYTESCKIHSQIPNKEDFSKFNGWTVALYSTDDKRLNVLICEVKDLDDFIIAYKDKHEQKQQKKR